jgi:hypothetical protein
LIPAEDESLKSFLGKRPSTEKVRPSKAPLKNPPDFIDLFDGFTKRDYNGDKRKGSTSPLSLNAEKEERMGRALKVFLLLFLSVIFTACASKTAALLQSRVGQMNYEEALQRFGPPVRCAEEGATKTCLWTYGTVGYTYAPVGRHFVLVPTEPPSLRLTFINGLLSTWELRGSWD